MTAGHHRALCPRQQLGPAAGVIAHHPAVVACGEDQGGLIVQAPETCQLRLSGRIPQKRMSGAPVAGQGMEHVVGDDGSGIDPERSGKVITGQVDWKAEYSRCRLGR